MTARCEPPEELRGVDGYDLLADNRGEEEIRKRRRSDHAGMYGWNTGTGWISYDTATAIGWRYLAPVTPPAEVAALRSALSALAAHTPEAHPEGEMVEVQGRVSRSESGQSMRLYGMTTDGGKTWTFDSGPHIAIITARVPIPRIPEIPATVERKP
jgi:hypothetical protein